MTLLSSAVSVSTAISLVIPTDTTKRHKSMPIMGLLTYIYIYICNRHLHQPWNKPQGPCNHVRVPVFTIKWDFRMYFESATNISHPYMGEWWTMSVRGYSGGNNGWIRGAVVINKTPFHVGHVIAIMHLPGGCTKEEHCDRTRPRHLLGHEDWNNQSFHQWLLVFVHVLCMEPQTEKSVVR